MPPFKNLEGFKKFHFTLRRLWGWILVVRQNCIFGSPSYL